MNSFYIRFLFLFTISGFIQGSTLPFTLRNVRYLTDVPEKLQPIFLGNLLYRASKDLDMHDLENILGNQKTLKLLPDNYLNLAFSIVSGILNDDIYNLNTAALDLFFKNKHVVERLSPKLLGRLLMHAVESYSLVLLDYILKTKDRYGNHFVFMRVDESDRIAAFQRSYQQKSSLAFRQFLEVELLTNYIPTEVFGNAMLFLADSGILSAKDFKAKMVYKSWFSFTNEKQFLQYDVMGRAAMLAAFNNRFDLAEMFITQSDEHVPGHYKEDVNYFKNPIYRSLSDALHSILKDSFSIPISAVMMLDPNERRLAIAACLHQSIALDKRTSDISEAFFESKLIYQLEPQDIRLAFYLAVIKSKWETVAKFKDIHVANFIPKTYWEDFIDLVKFPYRMQLTDEKIDQLQAVVKDIFSLKSSFMKQRFIQENSKDIEKMNALERIFSEAQKFWSFHLYGGFKIEEFLHSRLATL